MFTHQEIWRLVDRLAERHRLSLSALAKMAELDASTFSRTKRTRPNGTERWPSTESISRLLAATGTDPTEMVELMNGNRAMPVRLPATPIDRLTQKHFDDAGRPQKVGWRTEPFTYGVDPVAFALTVSDNSLEPDYHAGEKLIVCTTGRPALGDRLFVCLRDGEFVLGQMVERSPRNLILQTFGRNGRRRNLVRRDIRWLYRVRWCQY